MSFAGSLGRGLRGKDVWQDAVRFPTSHGFPPRPVADLKLSGRHFGSATRVPPQPVFELGRDARAEEDFDASEIQAAIARQNIGKEVCGEQCT